MRSLVSIFLAATVAAGPAYADDKQLLRGPVPAWATASEPMPVPEGASGLLFVRRYDTLIHLDERGEAKHLGYRFKILHPNALQLGNISIAWNPSAGAPTVHAVRVHRDGAGIDVLKNTSFEILRREDQLEAATLTGMLTAILRVPDLRVGDELELSVTIPSSDPTLGGSAAGLIALPPDPAPGRYRLALSWDEGQEPKLKMTPDMARIADRSARAVAFKFDNPATVVPPKDAPLRFAWQRVVEYSDFRDWGTISGHFAGLYAKAATLDPGSPLKEEARRIAAAHSDPLERASAALKLVQQHVRYIYVGLDGGNLTPASAGETWARRYGDCKGKTALLLALLKELGIEAEAVLVSNTGIDDGLNERLPSPGMFDHVLVRARIGGSTYWLDGTLPPVASPSTAPAFPYRWVLPLKSAGGAIEPLKWAAAEVPDEITLYEIDARAGFDKPARITTTTILRGLPGLQQQIELSALTPEQLLTAFRQREAGDSWHTIDDARWRYDATARASVLTVSGTQTVDWDDDGNEAKSLSLPGGGFSPPERRSRPADQNQDLPYAIKPEFSCHVTTVRLPSATKPAHWSFNTSYDTRFFGRNYYRAFDLRDGAIRMVRGSRVEQREIEAATARQDNGRISRFDNSKANISYDPAGGTSKVASGGRVPATYEIDWTAADLPCLASRKAD